MVVGMYLVRDPRFDLTKSMIIKVITFWEFSANQKKMKSN